MARWWERSPPINDVVRVQIPASTPYVGWVCCWFSPLLREVFLLGTPVSPSHQKSTLPNSNSTRNRVHEEPLCRCATSKSLFIYFIHLKVSLFIDNLIKDFLCKLLHKKQTVFLPQLLEIVPPVGDLRCFPLAYHSVGSSTRTYKDCINRDRNSLMSARQWRTLA